MSLSSTGHEPRVEDLVFEVICARARQTFAPLPVASLRGLLGRCALRPRDLKSLGERPVDMLIGENLQVGDGRTLGALFASAAIRRASQLPARGREVFVARLEELVAAMHERTNIRFPGKVSAILPERNRNEVTFGGDFPTQNDPAKPRETAMEAFLHNLPPIRPMRPPNQRKLRSLPPPSKTAPPASCRRFLRTDPSPQHQRVAHLIWMALELPPVDRARPSVPALELSWTPEDARPLADVRRHRPRSASAVLTAGGYAPNGQRPRNWTRMLSMAAGLTACVLGLPVALEGLATRSPALVATGAALTVAGLGLDAALTVLGPRLRGSRRKFE